jgi:hypothetical protein
LATEVVVAGREDVTGFMALLVRRTIASKIVLLAAIALSP